MGWVHPYERARRGGSVFRRLWRDRYPFIAGFVCALIVVVLIKPSSPEHAQAVQSTSDHGGLSLAERHQIAARNCDAARSVGLAPAYRGQPGYWPQLDADDDGISCEPYPRYR